MELLPPKPILPSSHPWFLDKSQTIIAKDYRSTVEDLKFTVELSPQGFVVVAKDVHDTISKTISETSSEDLTYFETPYSLLDSVSPGYREAFGKSLASQLRKISQEQN